MTTTQDIQDAGAITPSWATAVHLVNQIDPEVAATMLDTGEASSTEETEALIDALRAVHDVLGGHLVQVETTGALF